MVCTHKQVHTLTSNRRLRRHASLSSSSPLHAGFHTDDSPVSHLCVFIKHAMNEIANGVGKRAQPLWKPCSKATNRMYLSNPNAFWMKTEKDFLWGICRFKKDKHKPYNRAENWRMRTTLKSNAKRMAIPGQCACRPVFPSPSWALRFFLKPAKNSKGHISKSCSRKKSVSRLLTF